MFCASVAASGSGLTRVLRLLLLDLDSSEIDGRIHAEEGMMKPKFEIIVERDEDGCLVASVPALHGYHTQTRTLDELLHRAGEAIALCLEVRPQIVGRVEVLA